MPARVSEAFVLRTYPFREADLIVSFFTRDWGKLRGVARSVRRPKSRFGSGLERLSHIRIFYFHKETQELARLDRCELIGPPIFLRADYPTSVALDFVAEVSDPLMPDHEPNDTYFRLLRMVADEIWKGLTVGKTSSAGVAARVPVGVQQAARPSAGEENGKQSGADGDDPPGWLWRVLTYFTLWSVRLGGWLPPLDVCVLSGESFRPNETVYFTRSQEGLFRAEHRDRDAWPLAPESRAIAAEMLRKPLPELGHRPWSRATADDLRRFLIQRLEAHFEQRLKTAAVLAQL